MHHSSRGSHGQLGLWLELMRVGRRVEKHLEVEVLSWLKMVYLYELGGKVTDWKVTDSVEEMVMSSSGLS
jgi:hypothetical protein